MDKVLDFYPSFCRRTVCLEDGTMSHPTQLTTPSSNRAVPGSQAPPTGCSTRQTTMFLPEPTTVLLSRKRGQRVDDERWF